MFGHCVTMALCMFILLVVVFEATYADPARSSVGQRLDNISNKMQRMNRKLDRLKVGQNRQSGKLDRLLEKSGADGGSETTVTAGEAATTGGGSEPSTLQSISHNTNIQIVSVEKTPTSGGNRFKVRVTKTGDVFYRINDYVLPTREPDTVEEEEGGVWAASFESAHTQRGRLWFLVFDSDNDLMVSLTLNTSESSGSALEENLNQPELSYSPAEAALYNPGENVTFVAISPTTLGTGDVVEHITSFFSGVDLETGKFEIFMNSEGLIVEGESVPNEEEYRSTVTVLTGVKPVSGYLQFIVHGRDSDSLVVLDLQVSRHAQIRPANQSGEFPPGYLAMVEYPYFPKSDNGHELHQCPVGSSCPLSCYAAGERITGMFVNRITPDGAIENVPSAEDVPRTMPTARGISWLFLAGEDPGDSDGITTFRCRAYDTRDMKLATKFVDVQAVIRPSIDSDRSSVQVENDLMDPTIKKITFNCAIAGRPLPEVSFSGDFRFSSHNYVYANIPPDNVTPSGQNEAIATKVETLQTSELEEFLEQVRQGQAEYPYCSLQHPNEEGPVKHYFHIPEVH